MATDTPPAAADSPHEPARPDAGEERREGVLATMLGAAATPVEPARTPADAGPESDVTADDTPVTGAVSSDYHNGPENTDQTGGKNTANGQVDTNRSVLKTLALATIDRWAQGGNLAAKRLDIAKVQAQRAPKVDTKENRQTNRTQTTTTQNGNAAGAGGKNASVKDKKNSDKGRVNDNNKTQKQATSGNGGSTRQGPQGGAGTNSAGRTPAKQDTPKPAPKPMAKDTPAKPVKDTQAKGGGGAGKGPISSSGKSGSGSAGSGSSGPKGSGASQSGGGGKPAPVPTKSNGASNGGKSPAPSSGGKAPAQGPSPRPWKDPARGAGKNDSSGPTPSKKTPAPTGAGTSGTGSTGAGSNGKDTKGPTAPTPKLSKENKPSTGAGTGTSGRGAGGQQQGTGKTLNGTGTSGGKNTTPPSAPIWKDLKGSTPQPGHDNALKAHQDRLAKQHGTQKTPNGAGTQAADAGKSGTSAPGGGKTPGPRGQGTDTKAPGAGKGTTLAPGGTNKSNRGTGAGWQPPAGNTPVLSKTPKTDTSTTGAKTPGPRPSDIEGKGNQPSGRPTAASAGNGPQPTPASKAPAPATLPGPKNSTTWRPPADSKPVLSKASRENNAPRPAADPLPKPVTVAPPKPTGPAPTPQTKTADTSKPTTGPAPQNAPKTSTTPHVKDTTKPATTPKTPADPSPKTIAGPAPKEPPKISPTAPETTWKPALTSTAPKNRLAPDTTTPQPHKTKDTPPADGKPGTGRKLYDPAKPHLGAGADTAQLLKKPEEKRSTTPRPHGKQNAADKPVDQEKKRQLAAGLTNLVRFLDDYAENGIAAKPVIPPKPTRKPHVPQQTVTQKPQASIPTQATRTAGYRTGVRAAGAVGQARAFRDGARDGWADGMAASDHHKARLDQARQNRKKKDQPMTTPMTGAEYDAYIPDHMLPQPIDVQYTTGDDVILGRNAKRTSIPRVEVRSLAGFQRTLEVKNDIMTGVSERTRSLQARAKDQSDKVAYYLEQARAVQGGDKLLADLTRLAENSKTQESKAIEVEQRAARAAEYTQYVSGNVATRYDPIYQAVVDSGLSRTAELRYYENLGVTPNA
ncbi:hypothetical protein [Streptomyces olivaceiscleroticus]|uniref:Uncharacterized protein n=1 Tax=Streptomyces olivaceiscleroticus TaxID=68245 RepID=A0ABP3LI99_9ACTN